MFGRPNARKLKDQAQAAASKGKHKKALDAYLELERVEPKNGDWSRKAGEMYRQLGHKSDAVAAFSRAVDRYAESGFVVKAIAVCRLVLRVDPDHTDSQRRLVALQATRGIHVGGGQSDMLDTVEVSPSVSQATAPEPPPIPVSSPTRKKPRTLPPGEAFGQISLAESVAGSLPVPKLASDDESAQDSTELVFEIPLDDGDIEIVPELDDGTGQDADNATRHRAEVLSHTPLFSDLPPAVLHALISKVELVQLEPGKVLFHQGDPGDSLYVVSDGEVCVVDEGPPRVTLTTLGEGAFFGEVSLVTSNPRSATIEARVQTELLKVRRDVIGDLIEQEPEVLTIMLRFLRDRLVDNLIRSSPLFAPFGESERKTLAAKFRFLEIEPDTVLVMQGHRAKGLHILLSGHAEVVRHDEEGSRRLSTLSTGDMAGEMSLLANAEAIATVKTTAKTLALELPADTFREVIMTHPQVLMYVSDVAAERRRVFDAVIRGEADFQASRVELI